MDQWGLETRDDRGVEKGSYEKGLEVLEPRQGSRYVKQMLQNIRKQNEARF